MLSIFKNKTLFKPPTTLFGLREKCPHAFNHYKIYFEKINPCNVEKVELFMSLMTQDTYCSDYFGAFLPFFLHHNIAVLNDYTTIVHCFQVLNERLIALRN